MATVDNRCHQQHEADDGHFTDFSWSYIAAIDTHEKRDRDGGRNSERTPWTFSERLHHDQR